MKQGKPSEFDSSNFNPSALHTTKYGYEAIKLIHSIGKNLYIVISLLAVITIISIANTIGFHYIFAYDESIDFIVDISLSIILIIIIFPVVRLFIRSKTVLEKWMYMFERTSLSTSLNLALTDRDKKSALMAVGQSIEPVGELLHQYIIENESNFDKFVDVYFGDHLRFDVLIDSTRVTDLDSSTIKKTNESLKNALEEYGTIIIEIIDKITDLDSIEVFIEKLSKYKKITNNDVSLGIIIGESISPEAKTFVENYLNKKEKLVQLLILIEKPQVVA